LSSIARASSRRRSVVWQLVLTTTKEFDLPLEGEAVEALKLQRPLPDEALRFVARGEKEDP
jgi:hypothetical protein